MVLWNLMIPRAEGSGAWNEGNSTNSWSSWVAWGKNATSVVDNEEQFTIERPLRTAIIVFASLNVVVALLTAAGILRESYKACKQDNIQGYWSLRVALKDDTKSFPFILSCGIMVQGIVFAVVQSSGLENLMSLDCSSVSQLMLPALLVPSYIQLVFALHATTRALHRCRFSSRGNWKMTICLVIVGLLLLGTLSISLLVRPSDYCFASLLWFLQPYSTGCLTILSLITVVLLLSMTVVALRLRTSPNVEIPERLAMSHLVYYLGVGVLSNIFAVPFFIHMSISNPSYSAPETLALSTLASIAMNLTGLAIGVMYFLLRSNKLPILGLRGPEKGAFIESKKRVRAKTPSDCDFGFQIARPLSPPRSLRRSGSDRSSIADVNDEGKMLGGSNEVLKPHGNGFPHFNMVISRDLLPKLPSSVRISANIRPKATTPELENSRKQTEKKRVSSPLPALPPPSPRSSLVDLLVPPKIHVSHHKRDSSIISSATVQIGLRLSNVNDLPLHNSIFLRDSTQTLGCPNQAGSSRPRKPSPLCTSDVEIARSSASQDQGLTLNPDVYVPRRKSLGGVNTDIFDMSTSKLDSPRSQRSPVLPHDGPEVKQQDWI